MTDVKVKRVDATRDIFERAKNLDFRLSGIQIPVFPVCDLDPPYHAASHQLTRTKVVASPHGASKKGIDNSMAWWPADDAVFPGHECISGLLTEDGELNPSSNILGQVQIHRDVVIWLSWWGDGLDEPELYIEWGDVWCTGQSLFGKDQNGVQWSIHLSEWYAGYPPTWPTWLLPGA
jgi:hypothetical protein